MLSRQFCTRSKLPPLVITRWHKFEVLGDGDHEYAGGVRVACGIVEQEVNAKTAIVGLGGSSSIVLTQVKCQVNL